MNSDLQRQIGEERHEEYFKQYRSLPFWKRIIVLLAGIFVRKLVTPLNNVKASVEEIKAAIDQLCRKVVMEKLKKLSLKINYLETLQN